MTNQEAIETLKSARDALSPKLAMAIDVAVEALEKPNWIPITNEDGYCTLPKVDDEILVTYYHDFANCRGYYVTEAIVNCNIYGVKYVSDSWNEEIENVTAWAYKPEPYKEDDNDGNNSF